MLYFPYRDKLSMAILKVYCTIPLYSALLYHVMLCYATLCSPYQDKLTVAILEVYFIMSFYSILRCCTLLCSALRCYDVHAVLCYTVFYYAVLFVPGQLTVTVQEV